MTDRSRSTPAFRLVVTALAVGGYLAVGAATGTLGAIASVAAAAAGFGLAALLLVVSWRVPDATAADRRVEAIALAVALVVGAVAATVDPAVFGVMTWLLAWTLVPLAVLVVGRPRSLARALARTEASSADATASR